MRGSALTMFFFFQAEDGIRDIGVTGVQTCALPLLLAIRPSRSTRSRSLAAGPDSALRDPRFLRPAARMLSEPAITLGGDDVLRGRDAESDRMEGGDRKSVV